MEGSNLRKFFLFISTWLFMVTWSFASEYFSGDCINDADPDSRCVYLPLNVSKILGLYVTDEIYGDPALNYRLPNADIYVYAPYAGTGSDTITFSVNGVPVVNREKYVSDDDGLVNVLVTGQWPVSNVELGLATTADMNDVLVSRVYNYYAPKFQFCEDENCNKVITGTSGIQKNAGDTLTVYVQSIVPVGPSKGSLDAKVSEVPLYLSSTNESLKFLDKSGRPMMSTKINGTTYYVGSLSQSKSVFKVTSDGPISDVDVTLKSYVYTPSVGDAVFRVSEELPGNLKFVDAKYLYVLVPDDKDWLYDNMMVSTDGGETGTKMEVVPGMCGWYRMVWEKAPEEVVIYPQHDPDLVIGGEGLWGSGLDPLPLKTVLEAYDSDRLYFIPDDSQWPDDQGGFYISDPGVDGICSYQLAGVIYDTDEDLWKAEGLPHVFSTGEWKNEDNSGLAGNCIGVYKGIVQETLGPDKKPRLSTTGNGPLCFQDETTFSKLFNYTAGVNEVVCYDLSFDRWADGRWGYNSDYAVTEGYWGGFYPVENTTAADVVSINGQKLGPTTGANKKRLAEGPVQIKYSADFTYTGDFDKYCQSPGWTGDGSVDCGGLYANEKPYFSDGEHPSVWNWDANTGGIGGMSRWNYSAGVFRNQQYCFESHAKFRYSSDQEFSFRGNDDIWVFIAGKLAVDNGGTHLPAPGYVQLKNLKDAEGNALVEGREYDLDIFFCDRRTTMTSVIIKTNIFIKQTTGLSTTATKNSDGSESYSFCYDRSGEGSCADPVLGATSSGAIHACGAAIKTYGTLRYKITTRAGVDVAALTSGQMGWQYGGIDLSDPFNPKVKKNRIKGLAPGRYRLVAEFCDMNGQCDPKSRAHINFRIAGILDVMTQASVYQVSSADETSPYYNSGTRWTFVDKGLAGSRVPVYVSAFADGEVDLLSAVGSRYSLILDDGLVAYTKKNGGMQVAWPKTINETGIDTIWVTAPLDALTTSPTEFRVRLKSSAKINFYATAEEVPSSSSEEETSSTSTRSSSSMKQSSSSAKRSSSSVKPSSSSKNSQGGECTLTDKGDGRIIQKCGAQETVLYKALCGTEPYDPEGDYFCYGVKLYEKCDGEVYDVNSQKCVEGAVTDPGSGSSGKDNSQAIRTMTQVSWAVQTKGRTIHVLDARVGSPFALIDMQGRVLNSGIVNSKNFAIPVGLGGQYLLKIGNQSLVVRVW